MHPIKLRYELEENLFSVCVNYRSLTQINVNQLRSQHKTIYWVLIWYFCHVKLPYEFLIPYEEKALAEDFQRQYLFVRRRLVLDEYIEHYGLEAVQRLEQKIEKKRLRREKREAVAALNNKKEEEKKATSNSSAHTPGPA